MVQAVFCMEILYTYGILKVNEEAFIDYFQGCLLAYPYKNMFSIAWFSAVSDTFGLKHSDGDDKSL